MQIRIDQIPGKEKISSDQIVEEAVRSGHRIITAIKDVDTSGMKIRVQKLKKNSNPTYYGTVLLMLITKEDTFSASFDLTIQELKGVSFRLENSWNQIASNLKPGVVSE
jgi:hypothetical protein